MAESKPIIAQADVPAPGTTGVEGIYAFRAGHEIPPEWAEQHHDHLVEVGAVEAKSSRSASSSGPKDPASS